MNERIRQIADRIKEMRDLCGYTVDEMARSAGVSVEFYNRCERGLEDMSISFLYALSLKFGVEISALMTGEEPKLKIYSLVRKGEGIHVDRGDEYNYSSLAYKMSHKKVEPFLVMVPVSEEEVPHRHSHDGQEFNYLLEGTLRIYLDKREIVLNEGDSLYFNSNYPHAMRAEGDKPAKLLAIVI